MKSDRGDLVKEERSDYEGEFTLDEYFLQRMRMEYESERG